MLTFSGYRCGRKCDQLGDIYTIRPDGTGLRRLTHNPVGDETPNWAPMGHRLTYVHHETIWTMRADGSQKISLGVRGSGPTWAPDGTLIAYIGEADGAIHTVSPNGSGDTVVGNPVPDGTIYDLDWRPRH